MTFEETAKYLRTGESTLYKMTGEGKIPADTKNLSAIKTLDNLLKGDET